MKTWQIILILAVLIVASAAAVKKYSQNSGTGSNTGSPDEERNEAPNNGGRWQNRYDKMIPGDATLPNASRYAFGYRLKHGDKLYEVAGSPNGKTWKKIS